jgi:uncharacterized protein (DUF952 family)
MEYWSIKYCPQLSGARQKRLASSMGQRPISPTALSTSRRRNNSATAKKYFAGQDGLLLIAVDKNRLGGALRFEASRGGALFPHLYATLPLDAVVFAKPLTLLPDGRHDFAGLLG